MRLMGLDVGSKRRVAISDPMGWTRKDRNRQIDEANGEVGLLVLPIVKQYESRSLCSACRRIWITASFRAEASIPTESCLKELGLPVDYVDERLTTVQAEKMLINEGNVSRKKRKKVIDKLAAVILLQNYLDSQ